MSGASPATACDRRALHLDTATIDLDADVQRVLTLLRDRQVVG